MRVPLHIVENRREKLRGLIRTDGFLPVAEICSRLDISEATARRDLAAIEANGHITRTYGGALADYNASFASLNERANQASTAKGRIGAAALKRFPGAGTVFLDAGTTITALVRMLLNKRRDLRGLTIVTNSLPVATLLGGARGLELNMLGGTFLHRQAILLGKSTFNGLESWKFDAAFLGGEGMDSTGISNSHPEIAAFQRAVVDRSVDAYFCIDASKLGRTTPHRVGVWEELGALVTDATTTQLASAGITLPREQLILAK